MINAYFTSLAKSLERLNTAHVEEMVKTLTRAKQLGQTVWLAGNGGSAATAIHFANDLQKMCGIRTVALPANVSVVTAYGNDNGWTRMFSDAMGAFSPGDVLVAISFSGSSENVVNAAREAFLHGGQVVSLTGPLWDGNVLGQFDGIVATVINVENNDIKQVEDIHLAICHAVSGAIQNAVRSV